VFASGEARHRTTHHARAGNVACELTGLDALKSWINEVPEALSSMTTRACGNRSANLMTARFRLGKRTLFNALKVRTQ